MKIIKDAKTILIIGGSLGTFHVDDADIAVGSYLVRPSAVPVPAAVWLFGSGLAGLARCKKA